MRPQVTHAAAEVDPVAAAPVMMTDDQVTGIFVEKITQIPEMRFGLARTVKDILGGVSKSDDVAGRTRMYEAIVKGENILEPGLPESFNVLIKELQSLALDVELIEEDM